MAEAGSGDAAAHLIEELFDFFNRAWGRDDVSDAEIARYWDPGATLVTRFAALEGREYRGHDGLRRFLAESHEQFEQFDVVLERLVGVGETRVAVYRASARTRDSGIPIEQQLGMRIELRDGRIAEARVFADPREAVRAAGLDSPAG